MSDATRPTIEIPKPDRLRVGKYDVIDSKPFVGVTTEHPPRDQVKVQTALQALGEYTTQKHKLWRSWSARQRIAVMAMLLQLIWPAYIYTMASQSIYAPPSTAELVVYLAVALYFPAMVALGCAWLFFKPANY